MVFQAPTVQPFNQFKPSMIAVLERFEPILFVARFERLERLETFERLI
jgi:hypothetical protein